ncbi:hypothetical protein CDL12_21549 [Handroanthus impetiginosus]|uniref:Uncharacterized protein n=1 Tax=Handroanthus impetiginosus TaxID=429701 RepID=A0A2G9GKW4_9LAMI|nr:hypothetical protein CDL12_21549 [Handroanthus impetiginosus]
MPKLVLNSSKGTRRPPQCSKQKLGSHAAKASKVADFLGNEACNSQTCGFLYKDDLQGTTSWEYPYFRISLIPSSKVTSDMILKTLSRHG